jgi:hypothetical protein
MRGRVIEADGAADHIRGYTTIAMPENLVTFAEQFAREIK